MPHEDRQVCVVEDIPCNAAQKRLPPFAMGVSSHHEEIGAKFMREFQELRAHRPIVLWHGVGYG